MMFSRQLVLALALTFLCFTKAVTKKRDSERPVVKAVEGDTISLSCDRGAVTQETLYAVKWYKDEKEFFRNYPKADSPITVYPIDGFTLETPLPSPWQVILQNVNASASGKYTCMVVDYPRYRTIYKSTQVDVLSKNETLLQSHPPDVPRKLNSNNAPTFGNNSIALTFILLAFSLAFELK